MKFTTLRLKSQPRICRGKERAIEFHSVMFGGTHFLKTCTASMRQTPRECEEKWESLQRGICCLRSTESTEAVIVAATRPLSTSRRRSERAPALALKRHSHESWIIPGIVIPVALAVAILGCALYRAFV
jgi:hypothetical protein